MADTFDLDAIEVEGETSPPFEYTYKDEKFTLPVAAAMPWQTQVKLETANTVESLRLILGDQFERFEQLPMSAGRLGKLLEAWMAFQGLKPGE